VRREKRASANRPRNTVAYYSACAAVIMRDAFMRDAEGRPPELDAGGEGRQSYD
jgi:hypothetical protein